MDTVYQFLLPGVVVPFALSLVLIAFTLRQDWNGTWGLAAIWLLSYFWVRGLPHLPPREAVDWLWIIGIVTLVCGILPVTIKKQWLCLSGLLVLSLGVITWPVLQQGVMTGLSVELLVVIMVGAVLMRRLTAGKNNIPSALPLAIVSGGYAVIAALGGSLLIGQLSGALAAALGGFALYEFVPKAKATLLSVQAAVLASIWLLCLIVIGRVYANLALGPIVLLLVALVLSRLFVLQRHWQIVLVTAIPTIAAVVWLLLTQDSSSYY